MTWCKWSPTVYSVMSVFFWSSLCLWESFLWFYIVQLCSFSVLSSISLYVHSPVIDILIFSYFLYYEHSCSCYFWRYILCIYNIVLIFAGNIHREEWLGLRVCVCLAWTETAEQFYRVAAPFHAPTSHVWDCPSLRILISTWCLPLSFLRPSGEVAQNHSTETILDEVIAFILIAKCKNSTNDSG